MQNVDEAGVAGPFAKVDQAFVVGVHHFLGKFGFFIFNIFRIIFGFFSIIIFGFFCLDFFRFFGFFFGFFMDFFDFFSIFLIYSDFFRFLVIFDFL